MKFAQHIFITLILAIGLSVAAFGQKDDQKKPPKQNPPVVTPGKPPPPPRDNGGDKPKKPGFAFAVREDNYTLVLG